MVWPDRAQPNTAYDVDDFYNGEGCQYCNGQGHAFGGHPYSREGYLGNTRCPACLGAGLSKAGKSAAAVAAASNENNAPGGQQFGAPAIGGGGAVASTIEDKKTVTETNFTRLKNPNRALGVGQAT